MCVSLLLGVPNMCVPSEAYSTSKTLQLGGRNDDGSVWHLGEGLYYLRAYFKNGAGLVTSSPLYSFVSRAGGGAGGGS